MFVQILLIFGALFIILIAHILVTYIINVRKAKKLGLPIANASILPWWGHKLLNLKVESKKDVIVEFFKTHDLPMVANIDGFRFSIEVRDPELIKQIAVTKEKKFPKPSEEYSVLKIFGNNILITNGEEWEKHRRIVGPHFSLEKHLRMIHEASVTHAKTTFDIWKENNLVVPVREHLKNFTLDIIGSAAFGYELQALRNWSLNEYPKDEIPEGVTLTFNRSLQNVLGAAIIYNIFGSKILKYLPFEWAKTFYNSIEDFNKYIEFLMEKRRKHKEERFDLLSLMLDSQGLTDQEIKSNTYIFFIAGHETTAHTLNWAFLRLAQNPHVQEKLFEEVDRVLKGRDPQYEDLEKLPYTLWVFKETLRLHPPVRSIPKKTSEKVRLGDVKIPKNTMVSLNTAAAHKNPKYWENPEEFIPERFDESKHKITPFTYFPFSLGKRNCVGKKFALIEGIIMLAMLAQRFEVAFPEGADQEKYFEFEQQLSTLPKYDLPLVFKPRKQFCNIVIAK